MSEGSLIDSVCDRILLDKGRLEKNDLGRIEVEAFNLPEFWTQFGSAVQSLNNVVTKIGFVCGKKPFPATCDIDLMMQNLLQYYTVMRDLYLVLPKDVGAMLYKAVTSAVVEIMASLLDFVKSLHNLTENGANERLILTGTFWDACKAVDALPKDNLQAALKVLESEVDLASDAQEELKTALKEDMAGEDDSWSDSERTLAQNALGLVKVTHICVRWLKEAVGKAGMSAPSHQLDMAANAASTVSPALDNFVSELYHPVDFPTVYEMAEKLVGVLRSLLAMVKDSHFAIASSLDNINKMEKFISHNHQKVDPSISPAAQLASLSLNSAGHVTGSMWFSLLPYQIPCFVLGTDVSDMCGVISHNGHDCDTNMKPDAKKEKEPEEEQKTVTDDVSPTPPSTDGLSRRHPRTTDAVVVLCLTTFLLFYVLIKDWLLIAINGVLLCLYVFFVRRKLPVPAYGILDLDEYLNKM